MAAYYIEKIENGWKRIGTSTFKNKPSLPFKIRAYDLAEPLPFQSSSLKNEMLIDSTMILDLCLKLTNVLELQLDLNKYLMKMTGAETVYFLFPTIGQDELKIFVLGDAILEEPIEMPHLLSGLDQPQCYQKSYVMEDTSKEHISALEILHKKKIESFLGVPIMDRWNSNKLAFYVCMINKHLPISGVIEEESTSQNDEESISEEIDLISSVESLSTESGLNNQQSEMANLHEILFNSKPSNESVEDDLDNQSVKSAEDDGILTISDVSSEPLECDSIDLTSGISNICANPKFETEPLEYESTDEQGQIANDDRILSPSCVVELSDDEPSEVEFDYTARVIRKLTIDESTSRIGDVFNPYEIELIKDDELDDHIVKITCKPPQKDPRISYEVELTTFIVPKPIKEKPVIPICKFVINDKAVINEICDFISPIMMTMASPFGTIDNVQEMGLEEYLNVVDSIYEKYQDTDSFITNLLDYTHDFIGAETTQVLIYDLEKNSFSGKRIVYPRMSFTAANPKLDRGIIDMVIANCNMIYYKENSVNLDLHIEGSKCYKDPPFFVLSLPIRIKGSLVATVEFINKSSGSHFTTVDKNIAVICTCLVGFGFFL